MQEVKQIHKSKQSTVVVHMYKEVHLVALNADDMPLGIIAVRYTIQIRILVAEM